LNFDAPASGWALAHALGLGTDCGLNFDAPASGVGWALANASELDSAHALGSQMNMTVVAQVLVLVEIMASRQHRECVTLVADFAP
jgi:hypothetical protein